MSLWARLLSTDYREAVTAEAEGDLERAATAFARAGQPLEVIRLRRRLALAADPEGRVRQLRAALAVAGDAFVEPSLDRALRRDLARALAATGDPAALAEAVSGFRHLGDTGRTADALLRLGREAEARAILAEGHQFERLEALDEQTARRESDAAARDAALARAEALARDGDRAGALAALDALPGDAGDAGEALRARLGAARPDGRLALAATGTGAAITVVARLPAVLGRAPESPLPFSDPGISRHHARLDVEGGRFRLADLGSRNGTWVDGLPVGDGFALPAAGRFELGERCRVGFRHLGDQALRLEVEQGLATGARAVLLAGEADLEGIVPALPPVRLAVVRGFLRLSGAPLTLDGRAVPGAVDLLVGDRIGVGEVVLEVKRR